MEELDKWNNSKKVDIGDKEEFLKEKINYLE